MRALVLERQHELCLRDIDLPSEVGPDDVKVKIHTVGICGSDVHYYTHGQDRTVRGEGADGPRT